LAGSRIRDIRFCGFFFWVDISVGGFLAGKDGCNFILFVSSDWLYFQVSF